MYGMRSEQIFNFGTVAIKKTEKILGKMKKKQKSDFLPVKMPVFYSNWGGKLGFAGEFFFKKKLESDSPSK